MPDLVKAEADTSLDNITKLLQGLDFGKGKTTTKVGPDAGTSAQADAMFAQLMSGADPATVDAMVQNILLKAQEQFGPAIGNAKAAGGRAYSDTTLQFNANAAIARATGEAAKAKLDAMAASQKLAAGIVDTKLQQNKVQTVTQAPSLGTKLASGAFAGLSLYSKLKKKTGNVQSDSQIAAERAAGGGDVNAGNFAQGEQDTINAAGLNVNADGVSNAASVVESGVNLADTVTGGGLNELPSVDLASVADNTSNAVDTVATTSDVVSAAESSGDISSLFDLMDFGFADGGLVSGSNQAAISVSGRKKMKRRGDVERAGYADGGVTHRQPLGYQGSIISDLPKVAPIPKDPMFHANIVAAGAAAGLGPEDIAGILEASSSNEGGPGVGGVGTPGQATGVNPGTTDSPMGLVPMGLNPVSVAIFFGKVAQQVAAAQVNQGIDNEDAQVGQAMTAALEASPPPQGTQVAQISTETTSDASTAPAGPADSPGPGPAGPASDASTAGTGPGDAATGGDEADGGKIEGTGSGIADDKTINVSSNEFVVSADVVKIPGVLDLLEHLQETYHVPAAVQRSKMRKAA